VTEGGGTEPPAVSAAELAAGKRAQFEPIAEQLASGLVPDLAAFAPGAALSAMARWFCDRSGQRLVVVVGEHESGDVTDEILAYALAWQHDRDLVLVVPETHLGLTLDRLPWIDTRVRVFTYGDDRDPRPAIIPPQAEVLAAATSRPLRSTGTYDLQHRADLVAPLVHSLNEHWALVPAHRSSYLAWHCLGRQVVRIARTANGVTIQAGVAYRDPPPGAAKPLVLSVDEELLPVQIAEVEHRVAEAVWKRFAGHDHGHVEHRMQASLASRGLTELGFTSFTREYPAWRGDGRPGYIDFLAVDRRNTLHVIETKVGVADVKGVLQTLDYTTWVTAHAKEIRAELNWPNASRLGQETVTLDFILAPKETGPAIGKYLAGQLEALAGSLPWRIAIVTDPLAEVPRIAGPWHRTLPPLGPLVASPVQGARWAVSIGRELANDGP
jgi:hypothetical protein